MIFAPLGRCRRYQTLRDHPTTSTSKTRRAGMVRLAPGDTRAAYILSPRVPEPRTPERLAA
jgi:hypothetical protein